MEVIKPPSIKYGDTASDFLSKRIGDYITAHKDRFQHTRNNLRNKTSNETKRDETSEKVFVPVHINYKTFDPKEGPDERLVPIIFQHGGLASIENWGNIPQIFADETRRKVYALDARNHGDSGGSEALDREILAQDLIHFMNTNGIPKCILIGHSMGGISGLLAALMQPAMFEMLFLEDCAVSPLPQKLRDLLPTYLSILQGIISEVPPSTNEEEARIFIKEKLMKLLPKDPSKVKTRHSKSLPFSVKRHSDGRYSLKTNLAAVIPHITSSWPDPKGVYEGPAFFLYGTNSPYEVYNDEECIKRHFPNAELIPIEGAGHAIHMSCPDEFMEIVLKRLKITQNNPIFQKNKL
ncbi:abhydrolase domain-containing protein 11 [Trichonephila clavata]|uniref:sn-1-specific diacylglycerol lipase ABHD11 n=1 Tax=Trichonephila clavata TaxID=2740835 RepID=A0A8X6M6T8_TRICU|nr:abhydrolase domain-containing protein 11 [Trichonephila clavata]